MTTDDGCTTADGKSDGKMLYYPYHQFHYSLRDQGSSVCSRSEDLLSRNSRGTKKGHVVRECYPGFFGLSITSSGLDMSVSMSKLVLNNSI